MTKSDFLSLMRAVYDKHTKVLWQYQSLLENKYISFYTFKSSGLGISTYMTMRNENKNSRDKDI